MNFANLAANGGKNFSSAGVKSIEFTKREFIDLKKKIERSIL